MRGRQLHQAHTIGATAVVIDLRGVEAPIAVHLLPEAANDLTLDFSLSDNAVTDPANASWTGGTATTSAAAKRHVETGPAVAARIRRTTGSGNANKAEIFA